MRKGFCKEPERLGIKTLNSDDKTSKSRVFHGLTGYKRPLKMNIAESMVEDATRDVALFLGLPKLVSKSNMRSCLLIGKPIDS